MWSGGQTAPTQTTTGATQTTPAESGSLSEATIQNIVNPAVNAVKTIMEMDLTDAARRQKIRQAVNQYLDGVSNRQAVLSAIRSKLGGDALTVFNAAMSGGSRTGGGGGAGQAGGASNEEQLAEYKEEQHRSRMDSLEGKRDQYRDAADQLGDGIEDLEAKEVDLAANFETQNQQLDSEVAKIDASQDQLVYLQQKHQELMERAAHSDARLQQMRWQYAIALDKFVGLSKRDILEKVEAANEQSLYWFIRATNRMARAESGTGGEPITPSARTVDSMAPDEPNYFAMVKPHEDQLQGELSAIDESQINMNQQQDQINASYEQVARQREDLARQNANQEESLAEQIARSEERLDRINGHIDEVGDKIRESAAEYASSSS